jgi:hypothetical protein
LNFKIHGVNRTVPDILREDASKKFMTFFYSLLLFSSLAFAQTTAAPDPQSVQTLHQFNALSKLACALDVVSAKLPPTSRNPELTCTPDGETTTANTKPTQRIVFKYTSADQIPPALAQKIQASPQDLLSITPDAPWYVSFIDKNDNPVYSPKSGNDYGLTGSNALEVGKMSKSGVTFGVFGYTALFSDRVYSYLNKQTGTITYVPFVGYHATKGPVDTKRIHTGDVQQQQYNESNLMAFFMNDKAKGKMFFYDGAAGFITEQSNDISKIGETALQQSYHHFLGYQKIQDIPDGQDNEYGVYFKAMIGLQQKVFDHKNCSLKVWGEAGGSGDSSGRNDTYALQNAEADFTLKKVPGGMPVSIVFIGGANAQEGPISMAALKAGVGVTVNRLTLEGDAAYLVKGNGFSDAFTPNIPTRIDKDNIYTMKLILKIGPMH